MLSDRTTSGRWTSRADQIADGRVLKQVEIVDEQTREALAGRNQYRRDEGRRRQAAARRWSARTSPG